MKKIVLGSKQKKRIDVYDKCDACGKEYRPLFEYKTKKNKKVRICVDCEPDLLDKSFGRVDALDKAKHIGHFQTRKSKNKFK